MLGQGWIVPPEAPRVDQQPRGFEGVARGGSVGEDGISDSGIPITLELFALVLELGLGARGQKMLSIRPHQRHRVPHRVSLR